MQNMEEEKGRSQEDDHRKASHFPTILLLGFPPNKPQNCHTTKPKKRSEQWTATYPPIVFLSNNKWRNRAPGMCKPHKLVSPFLPRSLSGSLLFLAQRCIIYNTQRERNYDTDFSTL